jgi:hypothetical protein
MRNASIVLGRWFAPSRRSEAVRLGATKPSPSASSEAAVLDGSIGGQSLRADHADTLRDSSPSMDATGVIARHLGSRPSRPRRRRKRCAISVEPVPPLQMASCPVNLAAARSETKGQHRKFGHFTATGRPSERASFLPPAPVVSENIAGATMTADMVAALIVEIPSPVARPSQPLRSGMKSFGSGRAAPLAGPDVRVLPGRHRG